MRLLRFTRVWRCAMRQGVLCFASTNANRSSIDGGVPGLDLGTLILNHNSHRYSDRRRDFASSGVLLIHCHARMARVE